MVKYCKKHDSIYCDHKKVTDELLYTEILLAIRGILDKYRNRVKMEQALRVLAKFNLRIVQHYGEKCGKSKKASSK